MVALVFGFDNDCDVIGGLERVSVMYYTPQTLVAFNDSEHVAIIGDNGSGKTTLP